MLWSDLPLGEDSFDIIRAPLITVSRTGEKIRDWPSATEVTVTGAKVNPFELAAKLGLDYNVDREFSRASLKFYAPAGTDIKSTDRIRYAGQIFSVLGQPFEWTDLDGLPSHLEFIARYQEG